MESIVWSDFSEPLLLSAKVVLIASLIVFILGTGAARWMTQARFPGKTALETLFMLPLVLPPTVVGFFLLTALGRKSWIGIWSERIFHSPIVFTWEAAVISGVIMAFPLVYQSAKAGFQQIDKELEYAARSMGASELQTFLYVTVPLARNALVTAFILGFARALGEFGATLMVAGNIPGRTQTIPTAIYLAVESGRLEMAWLWTICLTILSFLMLLLTNRKS